MSRTCQEPFAHSNVLSPQSQLWNRDLRLVRPGRVTKRASRTSHELYLQFRICAIWIYLLLLFTLFKKNLLFRKLYRYIYVFYVIHRRYIKYIDIVCCVYRHKEIIRRRRRRARRRRNTSLITRSSETGLYRSRDCVIYNLKFIRVRPRFEDWATWNMVQFLHLTTGDWHDFWHFHLVELQIIIFWSSLFYNVME